MKILLCLWANLEILDHCTYFVFDAKEDLPRGGNWDLSYSLNKNYLVHFKISLEIVKIDF